MRKLDVPSISGQEKDIYIECASAFVRNEEYARVALSYVDEVEKCSKKYVEYVPYNIENFPHGQVNKKDRIIIEKVYTQKFAKKDSVGKKYYNVIVKNARGRCPICGGGKIKNLDHFLPKSKYPFLCVTIMNLIPTCRDCNMEKGAEMGTDYYEIPFHPYFDTITDKWVECEVTFYSDNSFLIKFKNGYDKSVNPQLWKKFEVHMSINDLDNTFNSRAAEELENVKPMYKKELLLCSKEDVKASLIEALESAEEVDINSWKSALYRELLRKCDEFCDWLEI